MTTVINGQWSERGAVVEGCSYGWEMRGKEAVGRERREKRERKKNHKKKMQYFIRCLYCVSYSLFNYQNSII